MQTCDLLTLEDGDKLLNTDAAVAWLAARGIQTSRGGLDRARKSGDLACVLTRGRHRLHYRPRDLARAFVIGLEPCLNSSAAKARPSGTFAERSRDKSFSEALKRAQSGSQKRSGRGFKRN